MGDAEPVAMKDIEIAREHASPEVGIAREQPDGADGA